MTGSRRFLRDASWQEVAALFHGHGGIEQAVVNARGWAYRFGADPGGIAGAPVRLEAWSADMLAAALDEMAALQPRMSVDMVRGVNNAQLPPRVDGLPAVVVQFGERFGMIDGKHRAHRWKRVPGDYAVLVIQC